MHIVFLDNGSCLIVYVSDSERSFKLDSYYGEHFQAVCLDLSCWTLPRVLNFDFGFQLSDSCCGFDNLFLIVLKVALAN